MAQIEITAGLGGNVMAFIPAARSEWEGLLPWQARRVRDYVDGGLAGRLSIRCAAAHAKLSPSYFSRRFRQSFGLTFSRFVARRRVEHAQAMMTKTSSSLCQIALACGFTDQAHFTRTFGGITGSTPSKWRRLAALGHRVEVMGSC